MTGELADVVCVAILAGSHGVDLGKALAAKIEARHCGDAQLASDQTRAIPSKTALHYPAT